MRPSVAVRVAALGALALLGAVAALAVVAQSRGTSSGSLQAVGSYTALAGAASSRLVGRHTACGGVIGADTEGIAHPTLPCGVRLFVTYEGTTVLAQVIDRGPYGPGRQFDLTEALAHRLGLAGVQLVRWAYARAS
jgi:rare lipoprotein A (peptidoglycan hydrolase)